MPIVTKTINSTRSLEPDGTVNKISFMEYVLDRRDYNIGVLERSYNL